MARPAVLVRFSLIILTTVGVAWMHSFGHSFAHAGHGHSATGHHGSLHTPSEQHLDPAITLAALSVVAVPICAAGCPDGAGMDPFAVCLAILSSLGLLLLLAAAGWIRARGRLTAWRAAVAWWPAGRDPPAPYLGLWLTRRSVLRI